MHHPPETAKRRRSLPARPVDHSRQVGTTAVTLAPHRIVLFKLIQHPTGLPTANSLRIESRSVSRKCATQAQASIHTCPDRKQPWDPQLHAAGALHKKRCWFGLRAPSLPPPLLRSNHRLGVKIGCEDQSRRRARTAWKAAVPGKPERSAGVRQRYNGGRAGAGVACSVHVAIPPHGDPPLIPNSLPPLRTRRVCCMASAPRRCACSLDPFWAKPPDHTGEAALQSSAAASRPPITSTANHLSSWPLTSCRCVRSACTSQEGAHANTDGPCFCALA